MITVIVPREVLIRLPPGPHWLEGYVLDSLRRQGAPVKGLFNPRLERGTITRTERFDTDEVVFTWTE